MDQSRMGKFIAACRKEQGMTQAALAEKFGISNRAVSKWETGKSMPDSGIMLELCGLLKINVNELLSGERIMEEKYDKRAEENLLRQCRENEEMSKKMLLMERIIAWILLLAYAVMIVCGLILINRQSFVLGFVLIISAVVMMFLGAFVGVWMEQTAGYYECAECGYRYRPTYRQALTAAHIGTSRKMQCPHCGKRNYHKKVISNKCSEK